MKFYLASLFTIFAAGNAFAGGSSTVGPASPFKLQCGNLIGNDGSAFVGVEAPSLDLYNKTVQTVMQASSPGAPLQFIAMQKTDVIPQPGSVKYSYQSSDRAYTALVEVIQNPQDPVFETVSAVLYYQNATATCPAAQVPVVTGP